ncbi:hypothetical protein Agub_g5525, partial [Astrephomene gubernaculifera]
SFLLHSCPHPDPELLSLLARAGGVLLSAGSVEWVAGEAEGRVLRAAGRQLGEPAVAGRLYPPGTPWRRRHPPWLLHARLLNTLTRRAAVAAFRCGGSSGGGGGGGGGGGSWQPTTAQPQLTDLKQFPRPYLSLLRLLTLLTRHPNTHLVSRQAEAALEVAAKRFPAVVPPTFLPYILAGIADVPYEGVGDEGDGKGFQRSGRLEEEASRQEQPQQVVEGGESALQAFFLRLRAAAVGSSSSSSGTSSGSSSKTATGAAPAPASASAATATPQESESERDGRVLGCCHALSSNLNLWRLVFRQPNWLAAVVHALLAARTHNATVPQTALGELLLALATRVLHPPYGSMYAVQLYDNGNRKTQETEGETMEVAGSGLYGDLVRELVELGSPGGGMLLQRKERGAAAASHRYQVVANVLLLLLLPNRWGPYEQRQQQQQQQGAAGAAAAGSGGAAAAGAAAGMEVAEGAGSGSLAVVGAPPTAGGVAPGERLPAPEVVEVVVRHMLRQLCGGEASPHLRQLGLTGTLLPLSAVLEYGQSLPQLPRILADVITSATATANTAVASSEASGSSSTLTTPTTTPTPTTTGWGSRLMRSLALGHSELDAAEGMKDKRGAGLLALQQRLLNSTFEELCATLAAVAADRAARWPADGLPPPAAVRQGAFLVRQARLVQLMAAAAPRE